MPKYKSLRRQETDWHNYMKRSDMALGRNRAILTMSDMYAWFRNIAHKPYYPSKIKAYIAARTYATGGRMPVTINRLPA